MCIPRLRSSKGLPWSLISLAGTLCIPPGRNEGHSHDALLPTILSPVIAHVISHFDSNRMNAVRTVERSDRPFEVNKLVYFYCIDARTKKFVPITSFPCMEILYVLKHVSFLSELAV